MPPRRLRGLSGHPGSAHGWRQQQQQQQLVAALLEMPGQAMLPSYIQARLNTVLSSCGFTTFSSNSTPLLNEDTSSSRDGHGDEMDERMSGQVERLIHHLQYLMYDLTMMKGHHVISSSLLDQAIPQETDTSSSQESAATFSSIAPHARVEAAPMSSKVINPNLNPKVPYGLVSPHHAAGTANPFLGKNGTCPEPEAVPRSQPPSAKPPPHNDAETWTVKPTAQFSANLLHSYLAMSWPPLRACLVSSRGAVLDDLALPSTWALPAAAYGAVVQALGMEHMVPELLYLLIPDQDLITSLLSLLLKDCPFLSLGLMAGLYPLTQDLDLDTTMFSRAGNYVGDGTSSALLKQSRDGSDIPSTLSFSSTSPVGLSAVAAGLSGDAILPSSKHRIAMIKAAYEKLSGTLSSKLASQVHGLERTLYQSSSVRILQQQQSTLSASEPTRQLGQSDATGGIKGSADTSSDHWKVGAAEAAAKEPRALEEPQQHYLADSLRLQSKDVDTTSEGPSQVGGPPSSTHVDAEDPRTCSADAVDHSRVADPSFDPVKDPFTYQDTLDHPASSPAAWRRLAEIRNAATGTAPGPSLMNIAVAAAAATAAACCLPLPGPPQLLPAWSLSSMSQGGSSSGVSWTQRLAAVIVATLTPGMPCPWLAVHSLPEVLPSLLGTNPYSALASTLALLELSSRLTSMPESASRKSETASAASGHSFAPALDMVLLHMAMGSIAELRQAQHQQALLQAVLARPSLLQLVTYWSLDASIQTAASRKIVSILNRMIHMHDLERSHGVVLSRGQLQDLHAEAAAELLPLAVVAPLQLVARLVSDGVHHAGQLDLVLELMGAFRPLMKSRSLCQVLFLQQQQQQQQHQQLERQQVLGSKGCVLTSGSSAVLHHTGEDGLLACTLRELLLGLPFPSFPKEPPSALRNDSQKGSSIEAISAESSSSQAFAAAATAPHHSPSDRSTLLRLCGALAEQGLLERSQQVQHVVVPVLRAWMTGGLLGGLDAQMYTALLLLADALRLDDQQLNIESAHVAPVSTPQHQVHQANPSSAGVTLIKVSAAMKQAASIMNHQWRSLGACSSTSQSPVVEQIIGLTDTGTAVLEASRTSANSFSLASLLLLLVQLQQSFRARSWSHSQHESVDNCVDTHLMQGIHHIMDHDSSRAARIMDGIQVLLPSLVTGEALDLLGRLVESLVLIIREEAVSMWPELLLLAGAASSDTLSAEQSDGGLVLANDNQQQDEGVALCSDSRKGLPLKQVEVVEHSSAHQLSYRHVEGEAADARVVLHELKELLHCTCQLLDRSSLMVLLPVLEVPLGLPSDEEEDDVSLRNKVLSILLPLELWRPARRQQQQRRSRSTRPTSSTTNLKPGSSTTAKDAADDEELVRRRLWESRLQDMLLWSSSSDAHAALLTQLLVRLGDDDDDDGSTEEEEEEVINNLDHSQISSERVCRLLQLPPPPLDGMARSVSGIMVRVMATSLAVTSSSASGDGLEALGKLRLPGSYLIASLSCILVGVLPAGPVARVLHLGLPALVRAFLRLEAIRSTGLVTYTPPVSTFRGSTQSKAAEAYAAERTVRAALQQQVPAYCGRPLRGGSRQRGVHKLSSRKDLMHIMTALDSSVSGSERAYCVHMAMASVRQAVRQSAVVAAAAAEHAARGSPSDHHSTNRSLTAFMQGAADRCFSQASKYMQAATEGQFVNDISRMLHNSVALETAAWKAAEDNGISWCLGWIGLIETVHTLVTCASLHEAVHEVSTASGGTSRDILHHLQLDIGTLQVLMLSLIRKVATPELVIKQEANDIGGRERGHQETGAKSVDASASDSSILGTLVVSIGHKLSITYREVLLLIKEALKPLAAKSHTENLKLALQQALLVAEKVAEDYLPSVGLFKEAEDDLITEALQSCLYE
ncbi:hypothetical protein CEUSTIGMA_g10240.t1 [Chlamydomonas eustigma]|uniref:Uncharacterized protein n=1 Tax=Chlamydomonas eustigma TaxID=1157962 RepID=A0A250XIA9_9CHLO|nr:hypothetical protein CEUSTIGMA_g10240.t1 [Chlamydomonas eustigma]|eukprot:GAX82814.1 hypothetical protein CEUSTIGMA_g10240.t1 [Chlamydomonas eustigma]